MSHRAIASMCVLTILMSVGGVWPAEAGRTAHRRLPNRLAAGSAHSCVVLDDGTVRCWGWGDYGQLGTGSTVSTQLPTLVTGLLVNNSRPADVLAVFAGAIHTCALRIDTIACWGANESGQIGDNSLIDRNRAVHLSIAGALDLALGISHTCALLQNGRVRCWGDNSFGQLGTGNRTPQIRATTAVNVSGLTDAVAIGAGLFHTCAVRVTGQVVCWGSNSAGQLGNNTRDGQCDPTVDCGQTTPQPVANLTQAIDVTAGETHSCALRANGRVRCWGANESGQLGDGTFVESLDATPVSDLEHVKAVSSGWYHTCALRADGTSVCWGANYSGQLGDDTFDNRGEPVLVLDLPLDAIGLAAGNTHSCVQRVNGAVSCWGFNEFGQLGAEPLGVVSDNPVAAAGVLGSVAAVALESGANHACAIRGTGTVACWGSNSQGQLTGVAGESSPNPTGPAPTLTGVVAAAAGERHTCALLVNGTVTCWGRVGVGETISAPTAVPGLENVVALAGGGFFRCALLADGTVRCWGQGASGELGNGTTEQVSPVEVNNLSTVVAITAGTFHACAIRANGTVRCWGYNGEGQLGNNSTSTTPTPDHVGVSGLNNARALAAGRTHTCAIRVTGAVTCWGGNGNGQLGTGGTTSSAVPVAVTNQLRTDLSTVIQTTIVATDVAAGYFHTCIAGATTTPTRTICWGSNGFLQVGMANLPGSTRHLVPTLVVGPEPTARGRSIVAGGLAHSCALRPDGAPFCWGAGQAGQNPRLSDRSDPQAIGSFSLNIVPVATLAGSGGAARLVVVANCLRGQQFTVDVQIEQGGFSATAHATRRCRGLLYEYPIVVPARGRQEFVVGPATATATAVIHESGQVVDTQTWRRQITIQP